MEITLKETWTNEQLCWHYQEIFWGGAKSRLNDYAQKHSLDEMEKLFNAIIDYATLGAAETEIDITEFNHIIWFDWEQILELAGIKE